MRVPATCFVTLAVTVTAGCGGGQPETTVARDRLTSAGFRIANILDERPTATIFFTSCLIEDDPIYVEIGLRPREIFIDAHSLKQLEQKDPDTVRSVQTYSKFVPEKHTTSNGYSASPAEDARTKEAIRKAWMAVTGRSP